MCPSGPALCIAAPLPVPFMVSAPPQPGSGRLLVVLSLHRRLRMGGSLSLLRKKANSSKGRGQPGSWGGDEGRAGCWGSPCCFRGPCCAPFLPGGSDRGDAYGSSSFPSELGDSRLSHCSLCAASLVPSCLRAEPPRLFPVPPPACGTLRAGRAVPLSQNHSSMQGTEQPRPRGKRRPCPLGGLAQGGPPRELQRVGGF